VTLTTEGLIQDIRRFREEKLALVALIGSMGVESEADALECLRWLRDNAALELTALRRTPKSKRVGDWHRYQAILSGVYELASEVEPWLAHVVALAEAEA
jgi:hypothetical protein